MYSFANPKTLTALLHCIGLLVMRYLLAARLRILLTTDQKVCRITMSDFSTSGSTITNSSHGNELLAMIRNIVPPLTYDKHKGQDGRIAVIGGCKEYTGAPYFAAMSAYRVGCDLSHVFCTEGAAPVIKSYSPDLIVHPELDVSDPVAAIQKWLPRMHGIVIGPGLGRDDKILQTVKELIGLIKASNIPMVIDADGLFLLVQSPDIIQGYQSAILTPNIVEFKHLYRKMLGRDPDPSNAVANVQELSKALGNVTVCLKGMDDIISDGRNVIVCASKGSPRRCGGQGDILSGTMGVFNFWAHQASSQANQTNDYILSSFGPPSCAAYAACLLTKRSSHLAFAEHKRSMSTTDVLAKVPQAFSEQYETFKSGL
ncbi:ATP-dependent (S)-NAD(P)H-hydrate dehydratase-like [Apostichopus japonicus]|uniref:ATP-dependent (S)-NAD(P)H-hydrate dehydratase-like n=1 Tax=Stichopus japonicus TaxID=307972 RepID=UPI003AB58C0B